MLAISTPNELAALALDKELLKNPLSKVEKDRMLVMFLSFLIIIVFWGAFEQADSQFLL